MRIIIIAICIAITSCQQQAPSQEDISLMERIATEELQRTDDFVASMKARLEFFGAPGEEAKYYNSSAALVELRRHLLNDQTPNSLIAFNDSLDNRIRAIEQSQIYEGTVSWDENDEHLKQYYQEQVSRGFDSLSYYKLLYTTLKKEYALHLSNARMMEH